MTDPEDPGATPRESGKPEHMSTNRINPERLLAQAGGISGVIYSSLPVIVFVIASSVSGLVPAIASAVGVAALILVWRLIRRESPQPAFSGFFGVALCALIAYVLGESKGYFLLGIWMSLVWAVVFTVSVLIRRPLVGYAWSWATGRGDAWRGVPRAVYAFDVASVGWVLVFAARYVVQGLLYDADRTGWLAAARLGMGWPLTALAALATYAAIKSAQRSIAAAVTPAAHVEPGALTD